MQELGNAFQGAQLRERDTRIDLRGDSGVGEKVKEQDIGKGE